jgi:ABC-type multidrug transport system ATPase subunit
LNKNLDVSGTLLANGRSIHEFDYKSYTTYAMQDDVLLESITVREALEFTAKLKMGQDWKFHVRLVIDALGLDHVLDSVIGG